MLAAANPDPGSNTLKPRQDGPLATARRKGSGWGLVTIDPDAMTVTFDLYRIGTNAGGEGDPDRFVGFPRTLPLK